MNRSVILFNTSTYRRTCTKDKMLNLGLIILLFVTASYNGRGVNCTVECPRNLPHTTAMKVFRGDYCYQFVSQEKYWTEARDYCLYNGGRLVKIDDSATNEFIINSLNGLWWRNDGVWIGLHDTISEMNFQWTGYKLYENEAVHWTNWGHGHPKAFLHSHRDCVRMVREGGKWKWHETPCKTLRWHYRFICEYRALKSSVSVALALTQDDTRLLTSNSNSSRSTLEKLLISPSTSDPQQSYQTETVGQTQTADESFMTSYDPVAFDEETVRELEEYYNDPAVKAAIYSAEKKLSPTEADDHGQRVIIIIVVFSCVIFCLILVVIFLLHKRRRSKMEGEDPYNTAAETTPDKQKHREVSIKSRMNNIYVDSEDAKKKEDHHAIDVSVKSTNQDECVDGYLTSRDCNELKEEEEEEDAMDKDCGMGGYDMPKPTNIYSEISGDGQDEENDDEDVLHIYETLDEVTANV